MSKPIDQKLVRFDLASPSVRLGAYLLETILITVTLGIGWMVWALVISGNGQTPAKKIMDLTVIDKISLKPLSLGKMFWLRGVLGYFATIIVTITLGLLSLMPFWDRHNQNLWDKFSSSYVVRNYLPCT